MIFDVQSFGGDEDNCPFCLILAKLTLRSNSYDLNGNWLPISMIKFSSFRDSEGHAVTFF